MHRKEYMPFKKLKALVKRLGIKSQSQWFKWAKTKNKPDNVPVGVSLAYNEWTNWYDFLSKKNKIILPYKKAKLLIKKLGLKTQKEYFKKVRYSNYPLPGNPVEVYKRINHKYIFYNCL
jgi:hypothetical protein